MSNVESLFDLGGKVAVVTGIMGRLGSVWAEALLEAGAYVLGLDQKVDVVSDPVQALQSQYPGKLHCFRADVCSRSDLEEALTHCREQVGPPDILVNNAGIDQPPGALGVSHVMDSVPFEISEKVFGVNTLGAFQCAQVFGKSMIESGGGKIINIGSMYGTVSPDSRMYDHIDMSPPFLKPPAYGASKAALVNISNYLATHWAPYGIQVNTLSPGGVFGGQDSTFKKKFAERVPMGRMAYPHELKGPLLFLASEASSYVTGVELVVDGGFTCW
ncbi:SDR family oxidoreductase [Pseudodesulfovibrio sp. F-1]|uniref:SDR family oxidoreductase n=1 Tax=Pseudodesulfovibrio alkaliphilus TaxID=2661613 RepID=A0A7K1KP00_9BACT|nr:SDR family oxidoreductase [Pseudodesulfovibrio alkaliphilus]MUM77809.1 SDR family oxidoreductase [Pseudodesulfovibrio alkaliphilus]